MNNWSYSDLLKLVEIKDKNIDHYLERITELESELERTRKALDLALYALTTIGGYLDYNDCVGVALDAKDEIYEVLERKE